MKSASKSVRAQNRAKSIRKTVASLWILEVAFYMALSFLVFVLTLQILSSYSYITDPVALPLKLPVIIFSSILAFTTDYIFYRSVFKRLSSHLRDKKNKMIFAFLLVLIPSLAAIFNLYSAFAIASWDVIEFLLVAMLDLFILHISVLMAFRIAEPKGRNMLSLPGMPFIFLGVFWSLLLCAIVLSYQRMNDPSMDVQFLRAVSYPIETVSYLMFFLATALFSWLPDPLATFYVLGITAFAMALSGILIFVFSSEADTARAKEWQKAIGFIILSFGLFLIIPTGSSREPELDWKVPSTNITRKITSGQFGVIYPFMSNMLSNNDISLGYMTCRDGNVFTVLQFFNDSSRSKNFFSIDTNNISDSGYPFVLEKSAKELGPCEKTYFRGENEFPEGFKCLNESRKNSFDSAGRSLIHSACEKLTYNSRELFSESSTDSYGTINDIEVSSNRQWAVISISTGFNTAENVYLVDLR